LIDTTLSEYYDALFQSDRQKALAIIESAIEKGVTPEEIVFDVVCPAIDKMIEDLTKTFDATISQHFLASKIAEEVVEMMTPRFQQVPSKAGNVVLGAAHSDFHGLGKRIVGGCLKAHMYSVTDLGLNVPAEKFVDEALNVNAQIIGISSMMVHTAKGKNGALKVRQILKERNLEKQIKLIVGGAPYRFDPEMYKDVGADGCAENGVAAVKLVQELIKE